MYHQLSAGVLGVWMTRVNLLSRLLLSVLRVLPAQLQLSSPPKKEPSAREASLQR
jgi:hypothetical protein